MTNMKTTLRLVVEFNILFLTPTQKKKEKRKRKRKTTWFYNYR